MVDDNVRRLETMMLRARDAGYNGIILDDYKFQILKELEPHYFHNLERVKESAAGLELDLFPVVARFGYSNGLLSNDPNLAEGVPVVRAPYRVRAGKATLVAETPMHLSADQMVPVSRFRQYHLSVDVKTRNFGPTRALPAVVVADGRRIAYFDKMPAPTQDWTNHHIVFNSTDNDMLDIRPLGWLEGSGDYSVRNASLREVGLVNVIRRAGAPLRVTSADEKTVYEEGRDFEIANNRPLGLMPRHGEFDFYHEPPQISLGANSRISEDETILVSYYHLVIVREGAVMCCLSEPVVYDMIKDQTSRLQELLQPKGFFLGINEVRVANWCESCRRRAMTPGEILADSARRCIQIVREASPGAEIVVWSDMFDPFHNAHNHYYLANGDLSGSWEGLDKDVIIGAWNFIAREQSLKYFASRGHKQMVIALLDRGMSETHEWSKAAAGVPNICGAAYITWRDDYSNLESFAEVMWNGAKS